MSLNTLQEDLKCIFATTSSLYTIETLNTIMSLIDLTTLNSTDTSEKVRILCEQVNTFNVQYPDIKNVAAICVYPAWVETLKKNLHLDSVKIAAVAAGFPDSQTFLEIKKQEIELTLQQGADEIDMVISVGKFLEGDYETVYQELKACKEVCQSHHLKVILETGALQSPEKIYNAAQLAMEAGADFIKTSTGKLQPAATLEAVYVMCLAIKDFEQKTGRKVGIKAAGGISTPQDALNYFAVVKAVLGESWLNPTWFRIGASKLANLLLNEILNFGNKSLNSISYF